MIGAALAFKIILLLNKLWVILLSIIVSSHGRNKKIVCIKIVCLHIQGSDMKLFFQRFQYLSLTKIHFFMSIASVVYVLIPSLTLATDVIKVDTDPLRWTITTKNASYQVFQTEENGLAPGFFGPVSGTRLYDIPGAGLPEHVGGFLREIPYRGGFQEMNPVVEVIFPDGVREMELVYDGYEISTVDNTTCLRLDLKDIYYHLTVSQYIKVIPELDLFEKWLVLTNKGNESITIERADSGSLVLPADSYDLIHISGNWGREFIPRRARLTSGQKSLFARGMRSGQHAPFFMVRPTGDNDEFNGPVWFGEMPWSGNWHLDFEVNRMEHTQISGGIYFWDTHWILGKDESFETPKLLYGFCTDGPFGASRRLHRYIQDEIMPEPFNRQVARVLYNSWEATTFNVTVENQIELAKIAGDIGIELFVMDDGWFKGRKTDNAGLGDWVPDTDKFPDGLDPLIEAVNSLGMDFGLWVEPEMVNPNSDLYRAHPEWALHTQHRTSHEMRNQLILNLARDDVKEYLVDVLDRILSDHNITFIKWDMNRYASETGWPEETSARQRELRIRYINNLYEILQTLRDKHPDVVFEGCSGGGGRVDTGILSVTDQTWTSDNSDPGDRLHIQYGYSYAFPAKSMVSWVTDSSWHGENFPLRFRFHVSMAANLGIGSNLKKWNESDKATARELISLYKDIRHIVQLGDQYRLCDPYTENRMSVQFASRDSSESVVFAFQILETVPMATKGSSSNDRLTLHGLKPAALYTVKNTVSGETQELTGKILMASGIDVPLKGNFTSTVIVIREK